MGGTMTDAGYFRGTSADQDNRFSDKEKKLMKQMKFEEVLGKKVDMSKIKLDVLKPWITKRISEMLKMEDDVVVEFIFNQLEEKEPDPRKIQINLTGFLNGKYARIFMGELWALLDSAQNSENGIPVELVNAKMDEIKTRKSEDEKMQEKLKRLAETVGAEAEASRDRERGERRRSRSRDRRRSRSRDNRRRRSHSREKRRDRDREDRDRRDQEKTERNDKDKEEKENGEHNGKNGKEEEKVNGEGDGEARHENGGSKIKRKFTEGPEEESNGQDDEEKNGDKNGEEMENGDAEEDKEKSPVIKKERSKS